jgi:hypothetical protein
VQEQDDMSDEFLAMILVFTTTLAVIRSLTVSWKKDSGVVGGFVRLIIYTALAVVIPLILITSI